MKYGLLTTSSVNIGDEVQSIATLRFLPHIDYVIHRERTNKFKTDLKVLCIMNNWWLWEKNSFPPSDSIQPLFVSFHLQYRLRNSAFMSSKVIDYFKRNEPIGCRDIGTANFLKQYGINAYFSGCLTSTLLPNKKLKDKFIHDYILCVDVPEDIVDTIKKKTSKKVLCIGRHQNICLTTSQRFQLAKLTLFLYHNASCVVTVALHAALPSTAFDTPVCVIAREGEDFKSRFEGLESCFNMYTAEDLLSKELYNFDDPPNNPNVIDSIREPLIQRCKEFTQFDRNRSVFDDIYNPLFDFARLTPYDEESIKKAFYFIGRKDLLKLLFDRFIHGKNRHDYLNNDISYFNDIY